MGSTQIMGFFIFYFLLLLFSMIFLKNLFFTFLLVFLGYFASPGNLGLILNYQGKQLVFNIFKILYIYINIKYNFKSIKNDLNWFLILVYMFIYFLTWPFYLFFSTLFYFIRFVLNNNISNFDFFFIYNEIDIFLLLCSNLIESSYYFYFIYIYIFSNYHCYIYF
jgi:hypothetical protein